MTERPGFTVDTPFRVDQTLFARQMAAQERDDEHHEMFGLLVCTAADGPSYEFETGTQFRFCPTCGRDLR